MAIGLLAVVDDVLSAAMKASAKTAGVVFDDAAVTPQYVQGLTPARELPVVGKISWFADHGKGSSINSVEDLNTFYYMQSGAELPKAPVAPKKAEPPAPTVLVVDQSVHHHYTKIG